MGQIGSLRDFMLIVRGTQRSGDFHRRVRAALELAVATHPEVSRRADFDVGAREHVEVFSAPDFATARDIAALRNGW